MPTRTTRMGFCSFERHSPRNVLNDIRIRDGVRRYQTFRVFASREDVRRVSAHEYACAACVFRRGSAATHVGARLGKRRLVFLIRLKSLRGEWFFRVTQTPNRWRGRMKTPTELGNAENKR